MRALLDINVVIALLDSDHAFHQQAHRWWASAAADGWASSPLTQNGVIRIMSQSAYNPRRSFSPDNIAMLLRTFASSSNHEFWPDQISLIDHQVVDTKRILGPRQVTDIYLLALARSMESCFVTFDGGINVSAVVGALPEHLVVL